MNCAYHNDREAIGGCVNCGNLICEGCTVEMDGKKYCKECISKGAGVSQTVVQPSNVGQNVGDKSWVSTLLLCWFLGIFGIHRFYVGKTGTAVIQLLTLGGCGIWSFIDFIMILCGSFNDGNGRKLVK